MTHRFAPLRSWSKRTSDDRRHSGPSALSAVGAAAVVALLVSTAHVAQGATHAHVDPDPPEAFGDLVVDSSTTCSDAAAQVAYVSNRVLVQTNRSPGFIAQRITNWATTQPKAGGGGGGTGLTAASPHRTLAPGVGGTSGVALVDRIDYPQPDDGLGPISPVLAFAISDPSSIDVVELARHLHGIEGVDASPDYVTLLQGHDFFQPDGMPRATTEAPISRAPFVTGDPDLGSDIRITVYDTGLAGTQPTSLLDNVDTVRNFDIEIPDRAVAGIADDLWVGHGLAISSEIAGLVPGAEITNARVTRQGVSTDFSSARRIAMTLANTPSADWPHLLVTAFGSMACDVEPGVSNDELVPVSLAAASETVDRLGAQLTADMAIVASAGNHGTARRTYPAAFDSVIAVGALDATLDADGDALTTASRTAPVAAFSAFGPWVALYAPGVDIVTLHVDGITFQELDHHGKIVDQVLIDGRALVNGTSFAAPNAAGQLAEIMSTQHVSVDQALTILSASGTAPQPPCDGSTNAADLGPGRAIALVDLSSPADTVGIPSVKVC